jgi:hypothetical protein
VCIERNAVSRRLQVLNGRPTLFYVNVLRVSPSLMLDTFLSNVNGTNTSYLSLLENLNLSSFN